MRFIILAFLFLVSASNLNAQNGPCQDLVFSDPQTPVYAPIARAAHIQGIVRFSVSVSSDAKAEIKLLNGPYILVGSARKYLEERRYYWPMQDQSAACSYTAQIEYRIIKPESDYSNNFYRLTVLGISHTLVEVQPVKPTCNDCQNNTCPLKGSIESQSPSYPHSAITAHIEGTISAVVTFDQTGQAKIVDHWDGPKILRRATRNYLLSWRLPSLPSYMDSCRRNVMLVYRLRSPGNQSEPSVISTKADDSHILVEANSPLSRDSELAVKQKKRFWFF